VLRFLLDTDAVSDLVRNPQGNVARMIAHHGEQSVATSVVVTSELRFGAMKRSSERLTAQLNIVLDELEILPLEPPADLRYAEIRVSLERAGTPIGPNDMLIAAHALALDLILVTGNTREFARVPMLSAVDWVNNSWGRDETANPDNRN
jgi:tRNA(fMet)-specific endonuclease VapC